MGSYYQILFFGPQASTPSIFFLPNAFNSYLLWWFIRLKRSHHRKEGNLRKTFSGREPQFLPCFLPAATAQKGGRAADDNVSRSAGVWMGKGQETEPQDCLFPVEMLSAEGVWGHSRAELQGREGCTPVHLYLHTLYQGTSAPWTKPSGCPALYHVCPIASLAERKYDKPARLLN